MHSLGSKLFKEDFGLVVCERAHAAPCTRVKFFAVARLHSHSAGRRPSRAASEMRAFQSLRYVATTSRRQAYLPLARGAPAFVPRVAGAAHSAPVAAAAAPRCISSFHGQPLTTASQKAVDHFDAAVTSYLALRGNPVAELDAAAQHDPDFALGYAVHALFYMMSWTLPVTSPVSGAVSQESYLHSTADTSQVLDDAASQSTSHTRRLSSPLSCRP